MNYELDALAKNGTWKSIDLDLVSILLVANGFTISNIR